MSSSYTLGSFSITSVLKPKFTKLSPSKPWITQSFGQILLDWPNADLITTVTGIWLNDLIKMDKLLPCATAGHRRAKENIDQQHDPKQNSKCNCKS